MPGSLVRGDASGSEGHGKVLALSGLFGQGLRSFDSNRGMALAGGLFNAGSAMLFWVVIARRMPVSIVGVASTIAAACATINLLTAFGVENGVAAYARRTPKPGALLNVGIGASAGASTIGAVIFAVGYGSHQKDLRMYLVGVGLLLFVVWNIAAAASPVMDIFTIVRGYGNLTFIRSVFIGISKVCLAILVPPKVPYIVAACFLPVLCSLLLGWALLRWKDPGFRSFGIRGAGARSAGRFAFRTTWSSLLFNLPTLLMPVIVLSLLGPVRAGWFYPAWSIVLVAALPGSMLSQIALSEVSDRADVQHAWSAEIGAMAISCVIAVGLFVFAPILLLFFGKTYAIASTGQVRILAVGLVPWTACAVKSATLRAQHRHVLVDVASVVYAVAAVGGAAMLAHRFGGEGVACAWIGAVALGAALVHAGSIILPIRRLRKTRYLHVRRY